MGVGGLGLHSLHPDKTRVYASGQQVQCQSNAPGRRRQGEGCLQALPDLTRQIPRIQMCDATRSRGAFQLSPRCTSVWVDE